MFGLQHGHLRIFSASFVVSLVLSGVQNLYILRIIHFRVMRIQTKETVLSVLPFPHHFLLYRSHRPRNTYIPFWKKCFSSISKGDKECFDLAFLTNLRAAGEWSLANITTLQQSLSRC
ncbi:hypothetical protein KC19_2G020000 [Ceratodon purpureus]|uniref:Uncharacterized protein n=1 Tax=Ceratodon purpureus TaxID=3225 RepID=A0A8T0IRX0_CERPU|nr:hypothetical protein KC19_2G020000 [Ceratodon purpureus]